MTSTPTHPPLTLEQLQAFHEELTALVRCGVPLEPSLRSAAAEPWGAQSELLRQLGARLEQGQPLPDALRGLNALPSSYLAVVAAAHRSGRLSEVLDSVTLSLRRAGRVRSTLMASLSYPVTVTVLAFVLLVLTLKYFSPDLVATVEQERSAAAESSLAWLRVLQQTMPWWCWLVPLSAGILWILGRRWALNGRSWRRSRWIGGLIWHGRLATFADILRLLLQSNAPLPEALTLAGEASGSSQLAQYAAQLARLHEGGPPPRPPADFPPLLDWLLRTAPQQSHLLQSVESIARQLERKAQAWEVWVGMTAPAVVSLLLGGAAVLMYAIVALSPWIVYIYRICEHEFF